jgi:hypothetical protein
LSLTKGRVIIVTEAWWGSSVEAQAISRCHRQTAVGAVKAVKMRGNNSLIDVNIPRARDIKIRINEEPMEDLIHKHDGLGGPFRLRGFAEMMLRCERNTPAPPANFTCSAK